MGKKQSVSKLTKDFRAASSTTLNSITRGLDITEPANGIRLKLITASSRDIDGRSLRAKTIRQKFKSHTVENLMAREGERYAMFLKEVKEIEAKFARSVYLRVRRAYSGTGSEKTLPLKSTTLRKRRYYGITNTSPYFATGDFYNSLRIDKNINSVYISKGSTKAIPSPSGSGVGRKPFPFITIWKINEFGTSSIPARPVFRPIVRKLLIQVNKDFEQLITKYFGEDN